MRNEKITPLYERLSRDDELQGESSCPICHNKTRIKIRIDTELRNFPLFCPKCKQETLIHVKQLNISVIREPDA